MRGCRRAAAGLLVCLAALAADASAPSPSCARASAPSGLACGVDAQTEEEIEAIERREAMALEVTLLQARVRAPSSRSTEIDAQGFVEPPAAAGGAPASDADVEHVSLLSQKVTVQVDSAQHASSPAQAELPGPPDPSSLPTQDSCAGDGTANQSAICQSIPSRVACAWSPGCNWAGQSHFGGWCGGAAGCSPIMGPSGCWSTAGCMWMPSMVTVNGTAAMLHDAMLAANGTGKCRGDDSPTQATYCQYVNSQAACEGVLGCNWDGANRFGGWCSGGKLCVANYDQATCQYNECSWVMARAAA